MQQRRLLPGENIVGLQGLTVGDFWSWAYSDILSNRNRALFAEFLVGSALGVVDSVRVEWDSVDLRYRGRTLEVKSSAYVQSWQQKALSKPRYDIARKKSWYAETNQYSLEAIHSADCYVFCFYPETDPSKVNILDATAWQFYVLATREIEQVFGTQKSVTVERLQTHCESVDYSILKESIDRILDTLE